MLRCKNLLSQNGIDRGHEQTPRACRCRCRAAINAAQLIPTRPAAAARVHILHRTKDALFSMKCDLASNCLAHRCACKGSCSLIWRSFASNNFVEQDLVQSGKCYLNPTKSKNRQYVQFASKRKSILGQFSVKESACCCFFHFYKSANA